MARIPPPVRNPPTKTPTPTGGAASVTPIPQAGNDENAITARAAIVAEVAFGL